jgi:hypothetical protein
VQDILRSSIISEFNSLNKFQKINGLKEIMLQVMDYSDIDSLTGARLCLTQYNDDDFYNETALDVSFFQEKNISHLVELHIVSDSQSLNKDDFIWSKSDRKDKHGNLIFDSKVKTSLHGLSKVLLHIVLDIYSYYISGLSEDYGFRRNFSKYKNQFLISTIGSDKISQTYHIAQPDDDCEILEEINYLPISACFSQTNKIINLSKTIEAYQTIIKEYIIPINSVFFSNKVLVLKEVYPYKEEFQKNIIEGFAVKKQFKRADFQKDWFFAICILCLDEAESIKEQRILNEIKSIIELKGIKTIKNEDNLLCICLNKDNLGDFIPQFSFFRWYKIENN